MGLIRIDVLASEAKLSKGKPLILILDRHGGEAASRWRRLWATAEG
jgi:hypothetical protein